jgi:hypothetical protein
MHIEQVQIAIEPTHFLKNEILLKQLLLIFLNQLSLILLINPDVLLAQNQILVFLN